MKKSILKVIALVSCFVMLFSVSAFAADSPDTSAVKDPATLVSGVEVSDKVVIDGEEVSVEVQVDPVSAEVAEKAEDTVKEVVKEVAATVLKALDISIEGLNEEQLAKGVKVTMTVPGVKANDNVFVLHQKEDGTWEKLEVSDVKTDSVTATFYSFSPVIVAVEAVADKPLGDSAHTALILVLVASLAVAACAGKKFLQTNI